MGSMAQLVVRNLEEEVKRRLRALAIRRGRSMEEQVRDTLIAGIALARRSAIATRNVPHFSDLEISVIDPWSG
jgi:plasmid stability protein